MQINIITLSMLTVQNQFLEFKINICLTDANLYMDHLKYLSFSWQEHSKSTL
jgi:hypothetical protein